jgi:hypothetical protein
MEWRGRLRETDPQALVRLPPLRYRSLDKNALQLRLLAGALTRRRLGARSAQRQATFRAPSAGRAEGLEHVDAR